MIIYELCLVMRLMPKQELTSALKRTANSIFEKGGILRKFDNLGTRDLPYKISNHGLVNKRASYYVLEFNIPPTKLDLLLDECARDVDIVRRSLYKKNVEEFKECTLEDEMKPPPYRKSVQELVAKARKLDKPKFKYNTGLDYYPFQK